MNNTTISSPIGPLTISADDDNIRKITFSEGTGGDLDKQLSHRVLSSACRQLEEYFDGDRTEFDLPLNPEGTDFQKKVWETLLDIPFGYTFTYLELAQKLGNRDTIRAAGRANGQNPIPIIIPCHRVIGSDGKLVGYSGGIERKQWLLKHEGAILF